MKEKRHWCWVFILGGLLWPMLLHAQPSPKVKLSVFNFGTVNIEASGYGTTVSNMIVSTLAANPSLAVLDRKELEAFLSLNDLQQNDDMNNVIQIGSRLGLDVIVVGTVERRGSIIHIRSNVIQIDRKRSILRTRVAAMGDAGLASETHKLSEEIRKAIAAHLQRHPDQDNPDLKSPTAVKKRPGNQKISLSWTPPEGKIAGYEIFRGSSEKGPFAKIDQVNLPEYTDEGIDRNKTYYYKIRAFDQKGVRSGFSTTLAAETALTPNPPVILSAESHIKSIALTWSPGPTNNEDPHKLKGYRLYRAKLEAGPYKEIANILGTDLGLGLDAALDKLLKVPYTDKALADGEAYHYKATAYNEAGLESEFSRPIKGTTVPVVKGLAARGDMVREIELTWDNLDLFPIRGYYVYRSTSPDGGFLKIKKVYAESAADRKIHYADTEGLADQTRYYYRVTALEEAETETSASSTVFAVTRGKPAMPTGIQAKSGLVKKVELTWTAGKDSDIEGYNVYGAQTKGGPFQLLKKITTRTVDRFLDEARGFGKLEDGTAYYYRLTSFNKVNVESDMTPVISATTKPRPKKPAGLKSEGIKIKGVALSWAPNSEPDIIAYHVFRAADLGDSFSPQGKTTGQTRYQDGNLKDGQSYQYKIQAEDKDELLSDFSDVITASTKPRPRPPQGLQGLSNSGGTEIKWNPSPEADIVSYAVYEKGFFKPERISPDIKQTSYTDERPLKAGKERVYVVTAIDRDGLESEISQELTVIGK